VCVRGVRLGCGVGVRRENEAGSVVVIVVFAVVDLIHVLSEKGLRFCKMNAKVVDKNLRSKIDVKKLFKKI
jgi:hypothetical protein